MKLYDVPPNTKIKLKCDGEESKLLFHHIDGMYSYCTNDKDEVVHIAAWTEVELDK